MYSQEEIEEIFNKKHTYKEIEKFLFDNKEFFNDKELEYYYNTLYIRMLKKISSDKKKIIDDLNFLNDSKKKNEIILKLIISDFNQIKNNKDIYEKKKEELSIYMKHKKKIINYLKEYNELLNKINMHEKLINNKLYLLKTNGLKSLYIFNIDLNYNNK